jgi:hypothetical protein
MPAPPRVGEFVAYVADERWSTGRRLDRVTDIVHSFDDRLGYVCIVRLVAAERGPVDG